MSASLQVRQRTTLLPLAYHSSGQLHRLTWENASTGNQVTEWEFGTTAADGIATGRLLRAKRYADGTRHVWQYNQQADPIRYTDANGNVHSYEYDLVGRILHDKVPVPEGSSIDGLVQRISYLYDAHGRLGQVTSWSEPGVGLGAVVNQCVFQYDAFGNLTEDWQAHLGTVVGATPMVGYEYANGAANHTRRTAMVYPNGRQLDYRYDTQGTEADLLSRIATLALQDENYIFASYQYLGVGSVISTLFPQPNVYKKLYTLGSTGDAGDIYTSLDRFGRLEEVRWDNASTTLERVLYGYDRVGNRTWRDVLTPDGSGTTPVTGLDEKYAYDGLYQVTQRQRGDLNTARTAISGTPVREEQLAYDPAGNWLAYTSKASGAITLDQRRGNNDLNQIASLSTALGATWNEETNPLTSDKVEHDANGNMLLLPHGSDGDWGKAMKLTWDAWNRLVKVEKASDGTEIASYQYDGLWRRTVKVVTGETRHYYYNDQWRSIEEHIEKVDTTKVVEQQHFWGPHHRREYIRRDRNITPLTTSVLNETLYGLSDAMSLTAIVDTTGTIKERYQYSAFGQRLCVSAAWAALTESTFAWMLGFHVEFSDAGGAGLVDTGLTNYGYRYFDPLFGRWANRDLIREQGGLNFYLFASNDALGRRDVLGLHDEMIDEDPEYSRSRNNSIESSALANREKARANRERERAEACPCGPDITDSLIATDKAIMAAWDAASPEQRANACEKAFELPDVTMGGLKFKNSWDIGDLQTKTPSKNPFGGTSCGEKGDCEHTVTVDGRCYYKGSVNYLLWGEINKLCNAPSKLGIDLITAYKAFAYSQSSSESPKSWYNAGFYGWASHTDENPKSKDSIRWFSSTEDDSPQESLPWLKRPTKKGFKVSAQPGSSSDCTPCSKKAPAVSLDGKIGSLRF